ncbi:MAG: endonuclease III [Ruminococcaceae bacterium]|nr:endonuclease III [Oscillospiraceae bacterium]
MNEKKKMAEVVDLLKKKYPAAECSLEYSGEPWRLLVMGRLSAQCTDARVNIVCRELFDVFPTARALADGDIEEIERIVRPCGLFHTKAADIKAECAKLCDEYGGVLPDKMEELLGFPGVGRKIANLLLGDIYHKPAIVADTHCIRICGRLGFYPEGQKDPTKVEKALVAITEPKEQSDLCHRLVLFGREICTARAPRCKECPLSHICTKNHEKI